MNEFNGPAEKKMSDVLMASLPMLAFGLAILAFLVAIDRPHWFILRPVSAATAAMAKASAPANNVVRSTEKRPGIDVSGGTSPK